MFQIDHKKIALALANFVKTMREGNNTNRREEGEGQTQTWRDVILIIVRDGVNHPKSLSKQGSAQH